VRKAPGAGPPPGGPVMVRGELTWDETKASGHMARSGHPATVTASCWSGAAARREAGNESRAATSSSTLLRREPLLRGPTFRVPSDTATIKRIRKKFRTGDKRSKHIETTLYASRLTVTREH